MPATMPYERFEAWKVSHELALAVYAATRGGHAQSSMA
jgi:hypothetical protein